MDNDKKGTTDYSKTGRISELSSKQNLSQMQKITPPIMPKESEKE